MKTIGKKVTGLVSSLGILMILVCALNVIAFMTIKDYNKAIEDDVYEYLELTGQSSSERGDELKEDLDYWFNKNDIKVEGTYIFNIILLAYGVVNIIVIIVLAKKTIAKPAKEASENLADIIGKIEAGEGDLTERIETKSKDEIGQLVDGFNTFLTRLQGIIKTIKGESEKLVSSADNVKEYVGTSNENAVNISAAMEEMSASMEEVAATIEQLATSCASILGRIQEVSEKAGEGAKLVEGIKDNSEVMYKDTVNSKEQAHEVIGSIKTELEASVEESKNVNKIGELTEDILGIAGQTNLLALNASIEAARAGEAKNADHMLEFIDEKVIADYDGFVKVVEQYRADAENINGILGEFASRAAEIEDVMQNMTQNISDVSVTVDESAKGVTDVAESAVTLVDSMSVITDETERNKKIAEALSGEVSRFKKV